MARRMDDEVSHPEAVEIRLRSRGRRPVGMALGLDPVEAISKGYVMGINQVGEAFSCGDAFLPELVMAGEAMKAAVKVPVVANGDIDSPQQAVQVLRHTGADAIMIGRAAQGRPWIFREIAHFLATGEALPPPDLMEVKAWLLDHLEDHYALYGEYTGVRSARKHLGWYARALPVPASEAEAFRRSINTLSGCEAQLACVRDTLDAWAQSLADPSTQEEHWKLAA